MILLLNEKDLEIYKVEQCSESQLKKIKGFYSKLNINHLMTLKGFYLIFWSELKILNLDKIYNFEQLCKKFKKYRKHIKRTENRKKLKLR